MTRTGPSEGTAPCCFVGGKYVRLLVAAKRGRSSFEPLCSFLHESRQNIRQIFDPSPQGFVDRVAHRQLKALKHALVRINTKLAHGSDCPGPRMVLFLAASLVGFEPDDVMPDFVEEDRQANGRLGTGR